MCGIIGYTGAKDALKILIDGLNFLEYRGYDSAGVAYFSEGRMKTVKTKGRVAKLADKLADADASSCGIGHTRWATHGEPSDANSHPHATDNLALVHNGIIENHADIAHELINHGYSFLSETDTEVAAKLIDFLYKKYRDPMRAIFKATEILRGSYAFGIVFAEFPNAIYSIRKGSPLIVAECEHGNFISSDITAILPYTKEYYPLDEGVLSIISNDGTHFFSKDRGELFPTKKKVSQSFEQAEKNGFPHFMIKEIHDEPEALLRTLTPRIKNRLPCFEADLINDSLFEFAKTLRIVACGTAMHAGLVGKHIIERLARVRVSVESAGEFIYSDPILSIDEPIIFLSQSGETADTLSALRYAKNHGITTVAVVNAPNSTAAREADIVIQTEAGAEISVASTKAYTAQCGIMFLFAIKLALVKGKIDPTSAAELCDSLINAVPLSIRSVLDKKEEIKNHAKEFINAKNLFFIGRGVDFALASEASLKLKEISYIHSEAYAAGELKHGTISLISHATPVIALLTDSNICQKTISAIREVKSRGATVTALCSSSIADSESVPCDTLLKIPNAPQGFELFPASTLFQLFAYYVSAEMGHSVDKPRNLAKSVTVE